MRRDIERRINELAMRQHGVLSREQILTCGLSPSALGRRLRSGGLRALHRGIYLVGPIAPPRAPEMAAVLATGGGMVSHASSFALWSGRPAPPAEPIDISITGAHRGHRPGIRLHRVAFIDASERTILEGIPTTTPLRTLADLAGAAGTHELESAVAWAEREGLVTRDELRALLERRRGRRGMRGLRALLHAPGEPAFTRSEAEKKFLALIREAGLPAPEVNTAMGPYEIDFLWRAAGIAVEVDGFRHHSLRPRFEGDRRKDAWLLSRGVHVVRLSWRQVTHEAVKTAVQLGHALLRAGDASVR